MYVWESTKTASRSGIKGMACIDNPKHSQQQNHSTLKAVSLTWAAHSADAALDRSPGNATAQMTHRQTTCTLITGGWWQGHHTPCVPFLILSICRRTDCSHYIPQARKEKVVISSLARIEEDEARKIQGKDHFIMTVDSYRVCKICLKYSLGLPNKRKPGDTMRT